MARLTAEQAGSFIARHIDLSWPNDKESVYEILNLVQREIWNTGLFSGSTKWFYVKVMEDNTIITPHGHNKLIGLKIGCEAATIKDQFWTLHKNGSFKEPDQGANFTKIVQHLGDYPTLIDHALKRDNKCFNKGGFKLAVISPASPSYTKYPSTIISGLGLDGKPLYSYVNQQTSLSRAVNKDDDEDDEIDEIEASYKEGDFLDPSEDIIEGMSLPISNKFITNECFVFSEISNISKEPTMGRVDYYAIPVDGCEQEAIKIASLEPYQIHSRYSIYQIKNECINQGCCYGLFKVSEPDKIVCDNQFMIIDNDKAILDFAKYIHKTYYKEDINGGQTFLGFGLAALNQQIQNENPTKETVTQIDSFRDMAFRSRPGVGVRSSRSWRR